MNFTKMGTTHTEKQQSNDKNNTMDSCNSWSFYPPLRFT